MLSWLAIPVAAALLPDAPAVPKLLYVPGEQGVDDARFTRWKAGDRLFVGVDGANLRASAPAGEVLAELPLAAEVVVVAPVGEPTVVIGRRNVWYRVKAGEREGVLFGSLLTPFGGHAAEVEPGPESWVFRDRPDWAAVFSPDFLPRIRYREGGDVKEVDLQPTTRFRGGTLEVAFSDYADGGKWMFRAELCADEPVEGVPPCVVGRLDDLGERIGPADAWRFEPRPAPEGHRVEELVATPYTGEVRVDQDGCRPVALGSGAVAGLPILRCDQFEPGEKGGWDATSTVFYAVRSAEEWLRLGGDARLNLWERSIREVAWPMKLGGVLALPEQLEHGGRTWRPTEVDAGRSLGPAFPHPLGPVERTTRGVVLDAPGGRVHYALSPGGLELDGVLYTAGEGYGCGQSDVLFREPSLTVADLRQVATSEMGEVYVLASLDHPVVERLEGSHPTVAAADWRFVTDGLGGVVRLEVMGDEHMRQCEPYVYVYGEAPVSITVEPATQVFVVDPPFDEAQTWHVAPRPDGVRLLWEGVSRWLARPSEGWVVRGPELERHLREVLTQAGLQGRELRDALRVMVPPHRSAPWVRVGWHGREAIDQAAPVSIRPRPDTVVRVLLELEALDAPEPLPPPTLRPIERGRTAVVEWGVVER